MKSRIYILPVVLIVLAGTLYSYYSDSGESTNHADTKMNGVNFVSPPKEIGIQEFEHIKRINATWISIIPYSYIPENASNVIFFKDHPHWWGEGVEGSAQQIALAKKAGLKVMVKPQVWVVEDGWPGEFNPGSEEAWKVWEASFSKYILTFARVSDSLKADVFCIGTEFRMAVVERADFWKQLIKDVRAIYSGEITYAANWDNVRNVGFWNDLDYVGVDAYFPLSEKRSPEKDELIEAWLQHKEMLKNISQETGKKILFTEYGYQSRDFGASTPWSETSGARVNIDLQSTAYNAFYNSFWREDWVAGGFLWKWFPEYMDTGGEKDPTFTPQHKQTEEVIAQWYGHNL